MMELDTEAWQEIRDTYNDLMEHPARTRADLKFGSTTILIYWAGTVLRIDFKET